MSERSDDDAAIGRAEWGRDLPALPDEAEYRARRDDAELEARVYGERSGNDRAVDPPGSGRGSADG